MKREIRLDYLCDNYGKKRFLDWCRSLYVFRFCKSHPYPDDLLPDRFIALLKVKEESSFLKILALMKIDLEEEYIEEFFGDSSRKVLSESVEIHRFQCSLQINKILKTITLEVSGNETDLFTLDESTFKRAKGIDDFLKTLDLEFSGSPFDDDYCITPEFYPEVWNKSF